METTLRLSRISKLLIDRTSMTTDDAFSRRSLYRVTLHCGADVARSRTLQVAVLTAASIANRCFPGAVRIALDPAAADEPLLLWPLFPSTFGQALVGVLGPDALISADDPGRYARAVVFGSALAPRGALRATFDGWIAKVGPAATTAVMAQREYCSLSGVLAGALAISELFLSFAELNIQAGRRIVGLSLWRPDLDISDPAALGVPVEFLARDFWTLGLGHLGNAYLWAIATLPYVAPQATRIFLNDFDKVEHENVETGLLFNPAHEGTYKTRVCSRWLEDRGFQTTLVERHFDSNFRCRSDEPKMAFCGFDRNPARRDIATAQFSLVMESGLGGTMDNFDTISFHTFPNPRSAEELWPDLTPDEEAKRIAHLERVALENPAYRPLSNDQCGRAELAGKSVAVPFVGSVAACLAVAEPIRLFHGGAAYTDIKLVLSDLGLRFARTTGNYGVRHLAGLNYSEARVA
jgi:hypothetical protein